MRVLVTGVRGQLGADLARALAGRAEVIAHDRASLDLSNAEQVVERVRDARPDVILNAAAYTAVDRAESDIEAARAVNATAPALLAAEARRCGALLVHYSTDYVFDGAKHSPYIETDAVAPLNAYGLTKLEGERAVTASGCDHLVLRTSWVYASRGKNFVLTMLRLAATHKELRIVDDQRGAPTSSLQLARATLAMLGARATGVMESADLQRARNASGLYHATAAGETSWFGFAQAIFEGWSEHASGFTPPRLIAIASSDYPTPARRPLNSVLSTEKMRGTFNITIPAWRDGLAEVLSGIAAA
jgi:dTDP-4-dehydrorhamnose reductase